MMQSLFLLAFLHLSAGDFFTSHVGFDSLIATEKLLLGNLRKYAFKVEKELSELNRVIDSISKEHTETQDNVEDFVNNPIRAFSLIKRLVITWPEINDKYNKDDLILNKINESSTMSFPEHNDLVGVALALARIQETYNLNIEDLTAGIVRGKKYSQALSWLDCFHIGHILYNTEFYRSALVWMEETKRKFLLSNDRNNYTLTDIYDNLAGNFIKLGMAEKARDAIHKMEVLRPNGHAITNRLNELNTMKVPENIYLHSKAYDLYQRTCRDEIVLPPSQQKLLKCRYKTGPALFLKLAPFKIEEVYLDPSITVYYNAITDSEIDFVINSAKPSLEASQIFGKNIVPNPRGRVSKSTFIDYRKQPILMKIFERLSYITDLKMQYTESFQVANYGLGGMYEPHVDGFRSDEVEGNFPEFGNRIGSAMFYLTDVEMGGSTAFNHLEVNVKPEKGKLVYWENLHSGGAIDYRTKHAGCPVVFGSKWVMNAWTRSIEQTFTRPCKLTDDNDVSSKYEDWKTFEDL